MVLLIVDVVTPYSPEHTPWEKLERAKESVEEQTVETNHLIIQDEEQRGPAWARNKGLEKSENCFVAFLDADDYWKPKKLEKQVERIEETGNGFCITGVDDLSDEEAVKQVFLEKLTSFTSSMLIDTEKASVRFDESLYRREDHFYAIQAIKESGFCSVSDELTLIDKHEEGLSNNEDLEKKLQAHKQLFSKATAKYPELNKYKTEFMDHVYHRIGRDFYFEGNYSRSSELLLKNSGLHWNKKSFAGFLLAKSRGVLN